MVNLYSRGGILYASYKEQGRRVRRSLCIKDTKQNRIYATRELLGEIERRLSVGIDTRHNLLLSAMFEEFIRNYDKSTTKKLYEFGGKTIIEIIGDKQVYEYAPIDFDMCLETLRKRGLSDTTIKLYFIPFNLIFKKAVELEIIPRNPIKVKISREKKEERGVFSKDEARLILSSAKDELKTLLMFLFYTGARVGEILALKWEDVKDDTIIINSTWHSFSQDSGAPKNGKSRVIPIFEPLRNFIDAFDDKRGEFVINIRHYNFFLRAFRGLLKSLNLKPQGLHSTRHSFISWLVGDGIDLTLIQKIVGHNDLSMIIKIYSHNIADPTKIKMIDKILSGTNLAQ